MELRRWHPTSKHITRDAEGPPWQGLEMEADPSRNAMIRHTAAAAVMAFVITGLLSISTRAAIRSVPEDSWRRHCRGPIDTNVASLMAAIFSLLHARDMQTRVIAMPFTSFCSRHLS